MDYLFTEKDTVLFLLVLVYVGFTFVKLIKIALSNQLERSFSGFKSMWLVVRFVFVLPLLWTFSYFL